MSMLNLQQRRFVQAYLVNGNATQAAKQAGYSGRTAYSQGQRLLKHVEIKKALGVSLARAEVSADRTLKEVGSLAYEPLPNIADLFDAAGNLRPLHELPEAVQRALSSVEVVRMNLAAGDGKTDIVH